MGGVVGNEGVKATSGADIAEWVLPEHRPIAAMVFGLLYQKRLKDVDGYLLQPMESLRVGVWYNRVKHHTVVGLRGTLLGAQGGLQDLKDDGVVSGLLGGASCDLGIVKEATTVMDTVMAASHLRTSWITVAGFSLGGSAAMCLGNMYPHVEVVSFAGGAPATQPTLVGPGPDRAIHYHVVGDLVSSHMSPAAATVVRVDKGFTDFSVVKHHSSDRFLRADWAGRRVDADFEDQLFLAWARGDNRSTAGKVSTWVKQGLISLLPSPLRTVAGMVDSQVDATFARVAESSPIPGSTRFLQTQGDPFTLATEFDKDDEDDESGEVL
ncbi:uncharacterized protein SPPG_00924 [Spizellomyces punctatus DAOM BR117]|uniref:Fungal lipase-like domain-containing protein n=1 Tax=Spizellomyces punctatus (strain DAOM BR117) TaxID=645134 RepID=A0A0L0HR73_SPIPD|nr:uncharacterized protein SPPG_00924 [Spizellomyces punctatus DAOM BR117]KND03440.1 hypothetical protein SPPG_00924 [Spizellomyces punctatus DAOM BR117]|eukprot:XP_016611479.1 hypothetical protein SPPG_00924 [Spizellomyces punctatus DAOM BR117]